MKIWGAEGGKAPMSYAKILVHFKNRVFWEERCYVGNVTKKGSCLIGDIVAIISSKLFDLIFSSLSISFFSWHELMNQGISL